MIVIVGYLAALLTTVSAVPQLIHTLRTRDVRGISLPSVLTLSAGLTLWLIYGLHVGSGPLVFANAVSLALNVSIVTLLVQTHLTVRSAVPTSS